MPGDLAGDLGGVADIILDEGAPQADFLRGDRINDVAEFLQIALYGADGLYDPDVGGDLAGQGADQGEEGEGVGFGAGAEDLSDQGHVVELLVQAV